MSTAIPANEAAFSLEEVVLATGGAALSRGGGAVGVSIDSRTIASGNAFVALVGERFDGHEHVAAAVERGASLLVIARDVPAPAGVSVVRVADTTVALGDLARAHRRRWAARASGLRPVVVAITGSAGKTTTRRAVAALLTELGARVHATAGNLNNAVGIPMVLFGLRDEHDTAVIEVGTSLPGETARGAAMVEPDVAILTLVTAAHSEGIGPLDAIAREKAALFEALGPRGVAIANGDNAHCAAALLRSRASRWIHYGASRRADVRLEAREVLGLSGSRISLTLHGPARGGGPDLPATPAELVATTPLLGGAGVYAAAAAVAAACVLRPRELSSSRVSAAFARLEEPEEGRLAPHVLADGTVLIDDSYNANRASMVVGIETAVELAAHLGRRLVLVLGEMRELGALSVEEHDAVGHAVVQARPVRVVSVAGDAQRIHGAADAAGLASTFVASADEAVTALVGAVAPGDLVLVKGSRSIGLDRVVRALAGERDPSR